MNATFVQTLGPPQYVGHVKHYRLQDDVVFEYFDGPQTIRYIVVSAASTPDHGPETFVFAADAAGDVTHWSELPGSYTGGLNHTKALEGFLGHIERTVTW